ncbi:MAG: damage-inducible protein DinB [Spirosomaceae bacterium]|jgi:uncharacterized damage-inducible protein DinB|nr:damage-inducible protein DinB [Spirosomataceae bacterium]
MKNYYKSLFEHEHWANLKVLESFIALPNPPQRVMQLFSHIIAAQRIWLDRITGKQTQVTPWEEFSTEIMLELLEINYVEILKLIENEDFEQLIHYTNSKGNAFINTISQIFTHLTLHASYHRGQIVSLIKPQVENLPITDYIFYVRN